jgi:hypothetical protein
LVTLAPPLIFLLKNTEATWLVSVVPVLVLVVVPVVVVQGMLF